MGFVLWGVESAWAILAAYVFTVCIARDRGVLERGIVAVVVGTTTILSCIYACGLVHVLTRGPLAASAFIVHAAMIGWSVRVVGVATLRTIAERDAGAPWRWLRDAHARHEIAAWTLLAGLCALAISALMITFFRSWTWDPVWYHVAITNYAIQHHTIAFERIGSPYIEGYVRNLELFSVWNCLLPMRNTLDDLAQYPFAILGGFVVAAWCQRTRASIAISGAMGALWIATPAVFLQIHSTHVDVAAGAMMLVAFYFLTQKRFGPLERWMTCLALGWYAGTKSTGLFHGALLAPFVVVRTIREVHRAEHRLRVAGDVLLSLIAMMWIGGIIYARNALAVHNPLWPVHSHWFNANWGGPIEPTVLTERPFLQEPGAVGRLLASWFNFTPFWAPDVRDGGFGMLFQFLTLPCILIVAADAVRGRDRWNTLPVTALAFASIALPRAWWARYTLGLPAAGLIAFALVHRGVVFPGVRVALSVLVTFLGLGTYAKATPGYITFPRYFERAVRADEVTRASLHLDAFLLDERAARLRETELRPGDVVAYDESLIFYAEMWTRDYRNRVEFAPDTGSDADYFARLRLLHPRWVVVGRGTRAQRLLQQAHASFTWIFDCPFSSAMVWRVNDYRW